MNKRTSPNEPTKSHYFKIIPGIASDKDLRQIISPYPKMLDKRIQKSLDSLSIEFIKASKLVILACASKQNRMRPLQVNQEGLSIRDNLSFSFPKTDATFLTFENESALYSSLYFMIQGLGHGLRVNGSIQKNATNTYIFNIEQVYFHCARAAARSALWSAEHSINSEMLNKDKFIEHSPFLLLKTINNKGKTELSPRGDNVGFVKTIDSNTLLLPERPGNKIAISLRNIIQQPEIELFFIIPTSKQTLSVLGIAKVITDQKLLRQCAVNGKIPKTGILIQIESTNLQAQPAMTESRLWDQDNKTNPNITSFSKALSTHINGTGLLGKATSVVVDVVVKHDMNNLY